MFTKHVENIANFFLLCKSLQLLTDVKLTDECEFLQQLQCLFMINIKIVELINRIKVIGNKTESIKGVPLVQQLKKIFIPFKNS